MINEQYNYDDNYFRMIGASLVKTLHTSLTWINYFHDQKIRVVVPFYLSLPGQEKYLLDAFVDDIPNARIELNTDQVPRGIVTFNSFSSDVTQFANPNEYLLNKREVNGQMKAFLQKTKAVPVKIQYDVDIVLNTEIDVLKCSEKLLSTLFNYMFFNLDYFGMKIDAVFTLPDDKDIEIQREINMDSDVKKHIKFPLTVESYYPIFLVEKDRYIDIDDFIICDNDDELDWDRLYKKRPSEMDSNDISSVRRVYWKNYLWDYDYLKDDDRLKGDNDRSDTPKENFIDITENIELSKYIKMFPKHSDLIGLEVYQTATLKPLYIKSILGIEDVESRLLCGINKDNNDNIQYYYVSKLEIKEPPRKP